MARLIDANALLEEHCDSCSLAQRKMCENDPVCGSAMWIVEAPTVDAIEVVRCVKCKWWDPDSEYCQFWHGIRHPEHYCGEGEKKDGKR